MAMMVSGSSLNFTEQALLSDVQPYLSFYGFNVTELEAKVAYIEAEDQRIFCLSLQPKNNKNDEVYWLQHGYLNHSGSMARLANELLAKGHSLLLCDLPGHGLSEAEKFCHIDDFRDYGKIFSSILRQHPLLKKRPVHVLAHSTGCSACLEVERQNPELLASICWIAPLIRSAFWYPSLMGLPLANLFFTKMKRGFRASTRNREYNDFIKYRDPLQAKHFSLGWVRALKNWQGRLQEMKTSEKQISVVQGSSDTVVDYRHNLKIIRSLYPRTEINSIKSARHEVHNERDDLNQELLRVINLAIYRL